MSIRNNFYGSLASTINSPLDLNPNAIYFDPSGLVLNTTNSFGSVSSGGLVYYKLDQGSNGYFPIQASISQRPLLISTFGSNNEAAIRYDGSNDSLVKTGMTALSSMTIIMAFKSIAYQLSDTIMCGSGNNIKRFLQTSATTLGIRDNSSDAITANLTINGTGVENIVIVKFEGNTVRMRANGGLWTNASCGVVAASTSLYFGRKASGPNDWGGEIADTVIFPSIMSDADCILVESLFNDKLGVF